jgi:hypothetical protein
MALNTPAAAQVFVCPQLRPPERRQSHVQVFSAKRRRQQPDNEQACDHKGAQNPAMQESRKGSYVIELIGSADQHCIGFLPNSIDQACNSLKINL